MQIKCKKFIKMKFKIMIKFHNNMIKLKINHIKMN